MVAAAARNGATINLPRIRVHRLARIEAVAQGGAARRAVPCSTNETVRN